jgi:membrane protein DedA with SNARE-associated domain/membrane-associated phospholipid phosphatase
MQGFLSAAAAHPHAALLLVFLVALAESLAVVGTLVPAALVMFGAGALIGAGALGLWITLAAAVAGAVIGDALSYQLGLARETQIRAWLVLAHHQSSLDRGEAFLKRWGSKSVLLARFTGPVRAFVPLLAGFGHMAPLRFYTVNILSALLWAPVHILPGVLFGSSLQVAEAVSGRLAVIVLLLVLMIWFFAWLVRAVFHIASPWLGKLRDRVVARSRTRKTHLARVALALLDPASPGSQALFLWALLLLATGWLFLGVMEDVVSRDPLVQLDLAVFRFLQAVRTPFMDRLMIAATEMGSVGVMLPLVLVVALWLAWRRSWQTVICWIAVTAFAQVLVLLLKFTLARQRPMDLYAGVERFSFPSGHAVLSTVILGFLAFLLGRGQVLPVRWLIGAIATMGVILICLSRIYLGAHWLSDVVGGISLGLAWIALASMVCTGRGVAEDYQPRWLMLIATCALVASGSLSIRLHALADHKRYEVTPQAQVVTQQQWLGGIWLQLPARRLEAAGDPEERFALQWACTGAGISARLAALGWQSAPAWSLQGTLQWLVPDAPLTQRPVLPRFDRGSKSSLVFVHSDTALPDERQVLRLWRSAWQVRTTGGAAVALWYGAVYREVRSQQVLLNSFGVLRQTLPPVTFIEQLPGDVLIQERTRSPGDLPAVLAACP